MLTVQFWQRLICCAGVIRGKKEILGSQSERWWCLQKKRLPSGSGCLYAGKNQFSALKVAVMGKEYNDITLELEVLSSLDIWVLIQSQASFHLSISISLVDHLLRELHWDGNAFQAIELDPNDATLLSNRSLCWLRAGQAERALEDAKTCRALRPDWAKACYREGAALRLLQVCESQRCVSIGDSFPVHLSLDNGIYMTQEVCSCGDTDRGLMKRRMHYMRGYSLTRRTKSLWARSGSKTSLRQKERKKRLC